MIQEQKNLQEKYEEIKKLQSDLNSYRARTHVTKKGELQIKKEEYERSAMGLEESNSKFLSAKEQHEELVIDQVVQEISSAFFLPKVEQVLLADHSQQTINKLKTSYAGREEEFTRQNTPDELISGLAAHLHISFVGYPALREINAQNDDAIINGFVKKVITKTALKVRNPNYDSSAPVTDQNSKDIMIPNGWNDLDLQATTIVVKAQLQELQNQTQANHYKNSAAYASNHSSIAPSMRNSGDERDANGSSTLTEEEIQKASTDAFMSDLMPSLVAVSNQQQSKRTGTSTLR